MSTVHNVSQFATPTSTSAFIGRETLGHIPNTINMYILNGSRTLMYIT